MTCTFQAQLTSKKSFLLKFVCLISLVFFVQYSYGNNNDDNISPHAEFSLQHKIQLPKIEASGGTWQQLIAHPMNDEHYFVQHSTGKIYLVEQEGKSSLLLDFSQLDNGKRRTLNTFTLHPDFSLKDQQGFATFYTAHTEASNKKSNTKRIQERSAQLAFSFDGVITQWQLDLTNPNQVDLASKREVVRITLANAKQGIQQLAFNPYIKSWNEGFGLLYIALDSTPSLQQFPLYSGALLRINPNNLGMRSFTVPAQNPFIENDNVDNSLYLIGAQRIKQFIWPDKDTERLLISHQYLARDNKSQQWLSQVQGGEDWRSHRPKNTLYKSYQLSENHHVLAYRGRKTPALFNKLLFLQNKNNQWQLSSINNTLTQPQLEWPLHHTFASKEPLNIYVDSEAELIFLQPNTGESFTLFQNNISVTESTKAEQDSNSSAYFFSILILLGLIWFSLFQMKLKKSSAKSLVRRQYANLALNEPDSAINLFKRHQKTVDKVIKISNVTQCQAFLGDKVLVTVDSDSGHGFSDEQEQDLRDFFNREHADKMIDGKVRRISIVITDDNKQSHTTCLYLRKGNDRITKKSYYLVIDDLIDWLWLIAKEINAEHTSNRKAKPDISAAQKSESDHKLHDETPLHKQAAFIRPATHQEPNNIEVSKSAMPEKNHADDNVVDIPQSTETDKKSSPLIDTELVNALEKLVNLKQQGFLSNEEFSKAKAKLLKNLID